MLFSHLHLHTRGRHSTLLCIKLLPNLGPHFKFFIQSAICKLVKKWAFLPSNNPGLFANYVSRLLYRLPEHLYLEIMLFDVVAFFEGLTWKTIRERFFKVVQKDGMCTWLAKRLPVQLIKSPLDRFRTPTERFVMPTETGLAIGRHGSRSWNAVPDWLKGRRALFFSRLFPVWVNGSSCYRRRRSWHWAAILGELLHHGEKKAITTQIPAGFDRSLFGCSWGRGYPGGSLGIGSNLEAGGRG